MPAEVSVGQTQPQQGFQVGEGSRPNLAEHREDAESGSVVHHIVQV